MHPRYHCQILLRRLALIDSTEIDDNTAGAIAEVSQGKEGLKVKLHDKKGALVDIGRHLGMFTMGFQQELRRASGVYKEGFRSRV